MKRFFLLFIILLLSFGTTAQQVGQLSGNVVDYAGNPVPLASVYIKGSTQGTSTNELGSFHLKLNAGIYQVVFRAIGFKLNQVRVQINGSNAPAITVKLESEKYQTSNAVYAAADDPAVSIIKNVIGKRQEHLNEVNAYSCNVYIKGVQKLVSAPAKMLSGAVAKQLDLDTNHLGILYVSESESQLNFQQRHKVKEVMISSKIAGNNNAFNFNRAASLPVNFYKNVFDIEGLSQRGFVSPVADNAFQHYDYKLLGTTTEDGRVIDKIQVIPKKQHDAVFNGNIYIVEGEWRIYSAHLYVTGDAGISLVSTLNIDEQYLHVKDNIWLPATVSYTYSGNVFGFKFGGNILAVYSNYNIDPKFPDEFFNGEIISISQQTRTRDSVYWANNRPIPLTRQEQIYYHFRDSLVTTRSTKRYLDSVEKAHNQFSFASYVFFGDTVNDYKNRRSLTFKPLYETIFYNTVEGWGVNLKAVYNKQFDFGRQYTITPQVRYGVAGKLLSINSDFSYTHDPIHQGVIYGKLGSNIYDLNSDSTINPFVNTISSLFFKENQLKLYRSRYAMLGLQREVARGLLLDGELEYARRNALVNTTTFTILDNKNKEFTSNNPLNPASDVPLLFQESNALTFRFGATYTFNEEYTTTPEGRFYDQSKYPKLKINYRKGINGLLGSDVDYDYADVQLFHNHINLGITGYSAFLIGAGKFFNTNSLIYPDYKQFRGNQGITFTPGIGGFHFLPYYTYSNDSFFEAHFEHDFGGYIFNRINGLRKLKLEEIIGANYLTQSSNKNYTEFYVGVQRFFFRLDYGVSYMGGKVFQQGIRLYYGL